METKNSRYKIITIICISAFMLSSLFFQEGKGQNIALNKSYTLSAAPNYALSAPASDKKSLTDGVYTSGRFWMAHTTVGWQYLPELSITVDLNKVQAIGSVSFNTARDVNSKINFPANIFVFLSNDNKGFYYAGDAALEAGNEQGGYAVKKFSLNQVNHAARFVRLIVVPQGAFVFCDEIEIGQGKNGNQLPQQLLVGDNDLAATLDSIKIIESQKQRVIQDFATLEKSYPNSNDLNGIDASLGNNTLNTDSLQAIETKILGMHARNLKSKFTAAFNVEKINPWDSLLPVHNPSSNSSLDYEFSELNKGVEYGAFVITNISGAKQTFTFSSDNSTNSAANIQIYRAPFVPSITNQVVPDPLVPIAGGVALLSGESQLFIFKISYNKPGKWQNSIKITANQKDVYLKINSNVSATAVNSSLNAVNWAYFNYSMIADRKDRAAADLYDHHINTMVVPPGIVPRPGETNFETFKTYISNFQPVKNIFLFANFASVNNQYVNRSVVYMSDAWKVAFKAWYQNILDILSAKGINSKNVYLYPYDEVDGKNIADFQKFAAWAKPNVPNLNLFATLNKRAAVDAMVPLLDIAQISYEPQLLGNLPAHHGEIWIYEARNAARSLFPYKDYRLRAWIAFANDYRGIGFWNYADIGRSKQVNLTTDHYYKSMDDYSVIYNGPGNEIISSRRWEAFKLGIEDYQVLSAYASKYGIDKAKGLANNVISQPDNVNLADDAINQMLNSL